jgi:hypothetical protein
MKKSRHQADDRNLKIGLVSDTHGLTRPELADLFDGCDMIIHAGDIGSREVLDELHLIAPVHAVRGNTDGAWAQDLPLTEMIEAGDKYIYVIHDISMLDIDPRAADVSAVIFGHSHMPSVSKHHGILYVNPGSAGPRRSGHPVSAGLMHINNSRIEAKTVKLNDLLLTIDP